MALAPGSSADVFPVSAPKKMLPRFDSTTNINIFFFSQGLVNFLERMIDEEKIPFPLDLSPYDFVATNCHTADEEVIDQSRMVFELKAFLSDQC